MSSTVSDSLDVYEDNLNDETMLDCSSQHLEAVPNIENEFISVSISLSQSFKTRLTDGLIVNGCNVLLYICNSFVLDEIKISFIVKNSRCSNVLHIQIFYLLLILLFQILYLQNNHISSLPQNFFPSLPNLKWLDLRDNKLTDLPSSIQAHPSLTHLLLQNNKLTSLPNELGTVATLKVLQIRGNPLTYPSKDVTKCGIKTIKQYLERKLTEVSLSDVTEDSVSYSEKMTISDGARSYNSVLEEIKKDYGGLTVKFNEKEIHDHESKKKARIIERCPRLYKGTTYCQSAKYLKPVRFGNKETQVEKLRLRYLKEAELKKQQDLLAGREKTLQDRK